jgi:hypothetical protein
VLLHINCQSELSGKFVAGRKTASEAFGIDQLTVTDAKTNDDEKVTNKQMRIFFIITELIKVNRIAQSPCLGI